MTFEDMCVEADEQLFNRLITDTNHVLGLHSQLPPPATGSQNYNLRHNTAVTGTLHQIVRL